MILVNKNSKELKQPVSLVEYALAQIRENIQTGKYPPGSKLSTQDISDALGVSRTPVQAAINRLIAEGLAEAIPRRGTIVAQHSPKQIRDIINVRLMIETYAADNIAYGSKKIARTLNSMESVVKQFDNLAVTEDQTLRAQLESRFHMLFVSLTDNQRLLKMYQDNWSVSMIFFMYNSARMPSERLNDFYHEHVAIVGHIREKKIPPLKALVHQHISSTLDALHKLIENDSAGLFKKDF